MKKIDIYEEYWIPFFIGLIIAYSVEKLLIDSLFFTDVYKLTWLVVLITWTSVYSAMNFRKFRKIQTIILGTIFLLFFSGLGQKIVPIFTMLKYDYFL